MIKLLRSAMVACVFGATMASVQSARISIGSGGTGGVYDPLGGGMADVLSKYVPGLQATADVTGGCIDDLKVLGAGKSEVGFTMADNGWDAIQGRDKFKDAKVNARTLLLYSSQRLRKVAPA